MMLPLLSDPLSKDVSGKGGKKKKREGKILICFFFFFLLSSVLKNVFGNDNIFALPEMSCEKQTYLSSKDLPVSNMFFVSDKS